MVITCLFLRPASAYRSGSVSDWGAGRPCSRGFRHAGAFGWAGRIEHRMASRGVFPGGVVTIGDPSEPVVPGRRNLAHLPMPAPIRAAGPGTNRFDEALVLRRV